MTRERKTFQFKVEAKGIGTNDQGQEVGRITAYGAVFNNIDSGNDKILGGSFKRTIQGCKARAKTRENPYILKMLWQHKTDDVIGGWTDLKEDEFGLRCEGDILLATQRGREYYELAIAKMMDEFSIMYDVPADGSRYTKDGVRELSELRLYSVDPVTFGMNDETYMVRIKSLEEKSICGNTSGPIGPRDEAWDGAKAKRQIWDAAEKEDGSLNATLAKKYFMVCDGDTQEKGSYSYPFWYVGDDPHICVGAVKAIVAAIGGARGASAPDGLKGKCETLYNRINKKYPDDTPLTPPWKDDGKRGNRRMERKTFAEHYNEEMAQDLLEDWQDVYVCALTCAIFDAFTIGDQPEQDISEALDAFKETVLSKFVAQGVECGLSDYLEGHGYSYTPGLTTMQNGSDDGRSGYGWMSRSTPMHQKAGRAISAATQDAIDDHVKGMKDLAKKAKSDMKAHVKAMHDEIRGVDDEMDSGEKSAANHQVKNAVAQAMQDHADKMHDMTDKAMSIMQEHTKAVTTAADDFANTIQGALKPAYGTGEGEAEDDQQEGRGKSQRSPYTRTPATQNERPRKSTALEDVEIPASWINDIRLHKAV